MNYCFTCITRVTDCLSHRRDLLHPQHYIPTPKQITEEIWEKSYCSPNLRKVLKREARAYQRVGDMLASFSRKAAGIEQCLSKAAALNKHLCLTRMRKLTSIWIASSLTHCITCYFNTVAWILKSMRAFKKDLRLSWNVISANSLNWGL